MKSKLLQKHPKRLARLTDDEDRRWEEMFSEHLNDGATEDSADRLTWEALQEEFPRLHEFDGCLPDPGQVRVNASEIRKRAAKEPRFLYHVTYMNRLNSIESEGLVPGSRGSIGGPAYDGHKQGRLFLTDAEGVDFWLDRAQMFAEHEADRPVEEGYVPVVLRTKWTAKLKAEVDQIGSDDSGAQAFFIVKPIPPSEIEYWSGSTWSRIIGTYCDEEAYKLGGDDEGYFKNDAPIFHPKLAASSGLLTTNNTKTLKQYQPSLVTTKNQKTQKGNAKGYLTGVMHLMPSDLSGYGNVCPSASPECRAHCLNTAGQWANHPKIQNGRKNRTKLYFEDREKFLADMRKSIDGLIREAKRKGVTPAIRVNGTSDLPQVAMQMAREYPSVQFYDYTKIKEPWKRTMHNYHLVFSRSELNHNEAMDTLKHGVDVAVVFDIKKGEPLPETWEGYPVIDGDKHDLRFLDHEEGDGPFVVGLRAKGKGRGKGSDSGFVVSIKPLPKPEEQELPKTAAEKQGPHVEFYEDGGFFEAPHDDDDE